MFFIIIIELREMWHFIYRQKQLQHLIASQLYVISQIRGMWITAFCLLRESTHNMKILSVKTEERKSKEKWILNVFLSDDDMNFGIKMTWNLKETESQD